MADVRRIEYIIDKLKAAKSNEWAAVIDEYQELIKSGLSLEEGLRAIESSLEFLAPAYTIQDNRAAMIAYLTDSSFPREHGVAAISHILEVYPLLPQNARVSAIWFLMNIPEREGAEAVMYLVRQHLHDGSIPDFAFNAYYMHSPNVEIYFPELLDYARLLSINGLLIWNICREFLNRKILKPEQLISHSSVVLHDYQNLKANLVREQSHLNHSRNETYIRDRENAGLLLDLLRFFPTDEIKRELLTSLEEYRDWVLLGWAWLIALWLDLPVDRDMVEHIAGNDEARNPFYDRLKKQSRTTLFPDQYCTKAAFAQSDMVTWLTYPTRLGCVPDEIELTHVVTEEVDGSIYEWFLFRFRSGDWTSEAKADPAKWLAGWSGPFLKDDPPGEVLTPGETYSKFEDWDSKLPEDHLRLNGEAKDGSTHSFKVIRVM